MTEAQERPKRAKTGGRQKGTPNKRTLGKLHLKGSTYQPLDFLLAVMRNTSAPMEMRLNAAAKAAPYCHRALKAVEFTGEGGGPVQFEVTLSFE